MGCEAGRLAVWLTGTVAGVLAPSPRLPPGCCVMSFTHLLRAQLFMAQTKEAVGSELVRVGANSPGPGVPCGLAFQLCANHCAGHSDDPFSPSGFVVTTQSSWKCSLSSQGAVSSPVPGAGSVWTV